MPEVIMPDIDPRGLLLKWKKREGDRVQIGEVIAEIETDKCFVEMSAEAAGVISIHVKAGDYVPVGTVLAVIN